MVAKLGISEEGVFVKAACGRTARAVWAADGGQREGNPARLLRPDRTSRLSNSFTNNSIGRLPGFCFSNKIIGPAAGGVKPAGRRNRPREERDSKGKETVGFVPFGYGADNGGGCSLTRRPNAQAAGKYRAPCAVCPWEPHRLAQIEIPKMNFGMLDYPDNLSYPLFQQVRDHQQAFSGIFGWAYTTLRIGQGAEARRASRARSDRRILFHARRFALRRAAVPCAERLRCTPASEARVWWPWFRAKKWQTAIGELAVL